MHGKKPTGFEYFHDSSGKVLRKNKKLTVFAKRDKRPSLISVKKEQKRLKELVKILTGSADSRDAKSLKRIKAQRQKNKKQLVLGRAKRISGIR